MRPTRWTRQEWETANLTLWIRSRDRCEWCSEPLKERVDRHHRMRKREGGDSFANLVLVHPECHTTGPYAIHTNVTEARELGFIVPTWADPLTTPILIGGIWYVLDLEGHREVAPPPEG